MLLEPGGMFAFTTKLVPRDLEIPHIHGSLRPVTVINRNGHCKPKFVLWFLVRSFYDQFSDRHCRFIRRLLPWIMAFRCYFVMPLIMTVQVPVILYVLQLPRDSVIGSFR